jgi:signal transduction histidine kinase
MPAPSAAPLTPPVVSEGFFAGQNLALQLIVSDAALESIFEVLVRTAEANLEGRTVGTILILDADKKRLRQGAAPSLPESYNRAIDGVAIGPEVGTCGAAAYRNEEVTTVDIEHDPGWSDLKQLPLALGLRAAWSMPIRSAAGQVLGTFGTYFRECRAPTAIEREMVGVLAKTAAVAIERRTTEAALRESETFLQGVMSASADCIKVVDLEGRLQWMSANGLCAMEVDDFAAIRGREWLNFWKDAATQGSAQEALAAARRGLVGRFQGECPTLRGTPKWWDVVVSMIRGHGGSARALLCVSRDITELKRTADALSLSEEALQQSLAELETRVERRTAELADINAQLRREIAERKKAEKARQELLQQLANAEESERRRISRELHDQVGQQLTALMLDLKSLRPRLGASDAATLDRLEAVTEAVGKEVHELALELRPTALDDLGLGQALAHYLEEWSARTGVAVQFRPALPGNERFSPSVETTIYRLILEALTNVAKHAGARRVAVAVERCEDHVLAIVEDDGRGFDLDSGARHETTPRLGLRGMRERGAHCGGTVNIESSPGQGTTVFARIPLLAREEAHA